MGYSAYDLDAMTRTLIGEAGNQGPAGMAAVANVIKNRADAGFAPSVSGVVFQKGQFEPWMTQGSANRLMNIDRNSPQYQQAENIARQVMDGQAADNTKGATHFYAPVAQAQLGRNDPAWANQFQHTATIGDHVFYQDPKYSNKLGFGRQEPDLKNVSPDGAPDTRQQSVPTTQAPVTPAPQPPPQMAGGIAPQAGPQPAPSAPSAAPTSLFGLLNAGYNAASTGEAPSLDNIFGSISAANSGNNANSGGDLTKPIGPPQPQAQPQATAPQAPMGVPRKPVDLSALMASLKNQPMLGIMG